MLRPESGVRGRRGAWLTAMLGAVGIFGSLNVAHAGPSHANPYPGTGLDASRTQAVAEARDQGSAGRPAGGLGDVDDQEQRAQELYLDGVEKLGAGRREWAQQTFESVIARFPNSAAATLARRELGSIYRGGATPLAATPQAPAKAVALPAQAEGTPEIGGDAVWEQELRRNASIQTMLRTEAGDRVFFSVGSAELGTRARAALAAQAQWLSRWHEFEAAIEGHADEPGTEEENRKLSEQRAEVVRQRLVAEGVEARRLVVVAQGRTLRIAICTEPGCSAQNRRTVTLVFASGVRDRLGLSTGTAAATLDQPQSRALDAAPTVEIPAAAKRVGVAR